MDKHPISYYGDGDAEDQRPGRRADCGGVLSAKELPYRPPVGPKNQFRQGPGLRGGTNHGNCGTQGKR